MAAATRSVAHRGGASDRQEVNPDALSGPESVKLFETIHWKRDAALKSSGGGLIQTASGCDWRLGAPLTNRSGRLSNAARMIAYH